MFVRGSIWRRWDLHIHTLSSFDYKYKGNDADELLCNQLKKANVSAVAITDHWKIDSDRIQRLRNLAPEVTFFPGIELRTDKGAANLHVILIFSEQSDLKKLQQCFEVTFLIENGKDKLIDNESVFFAWDKIIEFKKEYDAILMIHAASKSNGIEQITNKIPVAQAIKADIAKEVDIFEVSNLEDVQDYQEKVFKHIGERALAICSDNHNPREYDVREKLWLKSDLTFAGLKQCLSFPSQRIFIGEKPPKVEKFELNSDKYIREIVISKTKKSKYDDEWFSTKLTLNYGLISIVGNKGSGKSALADIIGFLGNSSNIDKASFLTTSRFRKGRHSLSKRYQGKLLWKSGQEMEALNLDDYGEERTREYVRFLPQKYIEEVCNELEESIFSQEINRVIFSYLEPKVQKSYENINDLIEDKSQGTIDSLEAYKRDLVILNKEILHLEYKMHPKYVKQLQEKENTIKLNIGVVDASKPILTENTKKSTEVIQNIKSIDEKIQQLKKGITEKESQKLELIDEKEKINGLTNKISELLSGAEKINEELKKLYQNQQYKFDGDDESNLFITCYIPSDINVIAQKVECSLAKVNEDIKEIGKVIHREDENRKQLINQSDLDSRQYQAQLDNLEKWKQSRENLIGSATDLESLEGVKYELSFLGNYGSQLKQKKEGRLKLVDSIFKKKCDLIELYKMIYDPAKKEISRLISLTGDEISLDPYFDISKYNDLITKTKKSFKIDVKIVDYEISEFSGILEFLDDIDRLIEGQLQSDIVLLTDKRDDVLSLYNDFYSLEYIEPKFRITLDGRSISEMSAGQRGLVLLVFYLLLDKDERPIIIDQPEDNLDNQSIYDRLVPCILNAKEKRQVIIVTHNPNIAVACDSEQIIVAEFLKRENKILYSAGSLESPQISKNIVDILEGTVPAFNRRKKNYENGELLC